MFDIKIDSNDLKRIQALLSHVPNAFKRAYSRTLRRTMSKAKTRSRQLILEKYYAKSGDISKSQSVSVSNNQGILRFRGPKKSLSDYYISPKSSKAANRLGGIRAAVKRTGIKNIRKAFIINRGKPGAFVRVGKGKSDIRKLMSPAIPQIAGNNEILEQLENDIQEFFIQRFNHEALYEIGAVAR